MKMNSSCCINKSCTSRIPVFHLITSTKCKGSTRWNIITLFVNYLPQAIIEARIRNLLWLLVGKIFTHIWYKLTASTPIHENVVRIKECNNAAITLQLFGSDVRLIPIKNTISNVISDMHSIIKIFAGNFERAFLKRK